MWIELKKVKIIQTLIKYILLSIMYHKIIKKIN
jgi:hypothetical protein